MRTRIGTRMIVGAGVVMAAAIGATAVIVVRANHAEMITQLTRSADLLSATVERSAHDYMLENHREKLARQIAAIGGQEGIERIRLFNKEGKIMFSSDPADVGGSLDKNAEACYACHAAGRPIEKLPTSARARIFRDAGGTRVLGIINPIPNGPGCSNATCHAHQAGASVLGVLDVTVSLADVDRGIERSEARIAAFAALAIALSSLLLWWLNRQLVLKPVRALAAGTRRVAQGDLTTTIPVTAGHELGDLARAFNEMMKHLAEARLQVTQAEKLASVGRLAAGVAHEINNPLTGVLTYSSFLLKRAGSDPALRDDLEVIVRETKRCRDIVKGLLDFARQTPPSRHPADLNDVARRAVAVVINQLSLNHVALALDLAADLPMVSADANQMQQVVVNLLLNAADAIGAAEQGGEIRLASRQSELSPFGHTPIRKASCPKGCDLLDPNARISGLPSIRVLRSGARGEAVVHLDPIYGRSNHIASDPYEEGVIVTYACPRCRATLVQRDRPCTLCSAASFAVLGPDGELIEWCARKGCHGSRWEQIEAAGARPFVEISVADQGCGISGEDQQHLFEPFFSTKGRRGTGLGLAVTWGIVESHGGTIEVESETGKGSRFTVRLPLEAGGKGATAEKLEPAGAVGAGHV